jgi:hypothetical protein
VRSFLAALGCAALLGGPVFAQALEQPPDSVTHAAIDAASAYLQVPPENLLVVMSVPRDWPDSSIGCPQPGMAYAQIIIPGYIVTVDTDDFVTEVQVHSDGDGQHTAIC